MLHKARLYLACQVHLTAKDGTRFILANAHINDGSKRDRTANINARIPGAADAQTRFKIRAIRNMLASLVGLAASQGESQGKPPVIVLAGDFNSQQAQVTEAIQGLIVPGLKHERMHFVGMDKLHLCKLKTVKPKDWLICSNYLEGLEWEGAFVAQDKQHCVVSAAMCPPPPPSHPPAASQGKGSTTKHPELAGAILKRMYNRQLARQQIEDDMARVEEMSDSQEKEEEGEPKTKKAKACFFCMCVAFAAWRRRVSSVIVAGLVG